MLLSRQDPLPFLLREAPDNAERWVYDYVHARANNFAEGNDFFEWMFPSDHEDEFNVHTLPLSGNWEACVSDEAAHRMARTVNCHALLYLRYLVATDHWRNAPTIEISRIRRMLRSVKVFCSAAIARQITYIVLDLSGKVKDVAIDFATCDENGEQTPADWLVSDHWWEAVEDHRID